MKKAKMLTADGSEFTVFYLKGDEDIVASNNLNEMDVNENSCAATFGNFQKAIDEAMMKEHLEEEKLLDEVKHSNVVHVDQLKHKLFSPFALDPISIDDTLEIDIVREPVVNSLYRIIGLNKIARFKGHSFIEGVHSKKYFKMSHHAQELYVLDNSLVEAKEIEVNNYMGKSL